jgi:transposase InsO family protein
VCKRLEVSERRACKVLSQPRGTQRYQPRRVDQDKLLVAAMRRLSPTHPRYGYRRITALLRAEGWCVHCKRVYRLWRQEGLKVPCKTRKRKRLGGFGEQLHSPASRAHQPRVELRFRGGSDRGRPAAQDAGGPG